MVQFARSFAIAAIVAASLFVAPSAFATGGYGAPFSDDGATDAAVQPPITSTPVVPAPPLPIPPITIPPIGGTPPPAPVKPTPIDPVKLAQEQGRKLCEQFMPPMYEGYAEYAAKYGVTQAAMIFVQIPGSVDLETMKHCWNFGHKPSEISWDQIEDPAIVSRLCCQMYPTVADDFYTSLPKTSAPGDNGGIIYDVRNVQPRKLAYCMAASSGYYTDVPYFAQIPTASQYSSGTRCTPRY